MPKFTEGDFLDGEGAAKLLAYIIQKIETAKQLGKDVAVQTLPAALTTPVADAPTETPGWIAHGTLLELQETIGLSPESTLKCNVQLTATDNSATAYLIPALYRKIETDTCELVASFEKTQLTSNGWYTIALSKMNDLILDAADTFYLVFLHNQQETQLLGHAAPTVRVTKEIAWVSDNLGNISKAPSTLQIAQESLISFYGQVTGSRIFS